MRYNFIACIAALALSSRAGAARACGSTNSTSTYTWRVSDGRYDSVNKGSAIVAVSIVPTNRSYGTFFECVASWPESWQGWENGRGNIVWSDCIWAGNGLTDDTTVSFAVDWANYTMYVSHTFTCSDAQGLVSQQMSDCALPLREDLT
jgi:hypothetical protein